LFCSIALNQAKFTTRTRCYGCFRPASQCYCDAIPTILNRTEILLVQHARERDHPFNTARMVRRALKNCTLISGNNSDLAKTGLALSPRAGLLYPGRNAVTLSEIPAHQMPEQLVVIDGTWAQSKTILRDLPQLQRLPCFKLAPSQPGQYRIRLEPTDTSLSTVEATVLALQAIEPETPGLQQLLAAFDTMVQRQLDHPSVGRETYSNGPKNGRTVNVPKSLLGDRSRIVVAYGEAGYRDPKRLTAGESEAARPPLFWVAQRLSDDNVFARAIEPEVEMTPSFLNHLELSKQHFENAISIEAFRDHWQCFVQADDILVVYNRGSICLLENVGADFVKSMTLKSINFDQQTTGQTLCEFVHSRKLPGPASNPGHGRAGKRLANAVALVDYLRAVVA
jgi:DTW domain-containing protein YfiP